MRGHSATVPFLQSSRESGTAERIKNLDTITIIDVTHMSRTGGVTSDNTCIGSTTDLSSNYTVLFANNPKDRASCFYCIRIFARTINILEEIESIEFF